MVRWWPNIEAGTELATSGLDGFSNNLTSKLDGFGDHQDSILDGVAAS
jgi:hypothetical protein